MRPGKWHGKGMSPPPAPGGTLAYPPRPHSATGRTSTPSEGFAFRASVLAPMHAHGVPGLPGLPGLRVEAGQGQIRETDCTTPGPFGHRSHRPLPA